MPPTIPQYTAVLIVPPDEAYTFRAAILIEGVAPAKPDRMLVTVA